jgi:hypothetical protein
MIRIERRYVLHGSLDDVPAMQGGEEKGGSWVLGEIGDVFFSPA